MCPKYSIEPSHDASSIVNGPVDNGVDADDSSMGRAGDNHPIAHADENVPIFAVWGNL